MALGTTVLCAARERQFHKAVAQNGPLSGSAERVSPAPGDGEAGQVGAHTRSVLVLAPVFSSLRGCRQPALILILPVKAIGGLEDGCLSPCFHTWCPLLARGEPVPKNPGWSPAKPQGFLLRQFPCTELSGGEMGPLGESVLA